MKEMSEVRAKKLAKKVSLSIIVGLTMLIMMAIMSNGKRLNLWLFSGGWSMAVIITLSVAIIAVLFLHLYVFPQRIKQYPKHNDYNCDPAAKLLSKPRLIMMGVMLLLTAILTIAASIIWPVGTAPKQIPQTVYYGKDQQTLLSGDFGTLAILGTNPQGEECLWVCSIDSYGPINYSGSTGEIFATQTIINYATRSDVDEKIIDSTSVNAAFIKINHYEDGDWVIVKHFVQEDNLVPIEDRNLLTILLEMIGADEIPYEIHKFKSDDTEKTKLEVLNQATFDFLPWVATSDGFSLDETGGVK